MSFLVAHDDRSSAAKRASERERMFAASGRHPESAASKKDERTRPTASRGKRCITWSRLLSGRWLYAEKRPSGRRCFGPLLIDSFGRPSLCVPKRATGAESGGFGGHRQ